LEKANKGLSLLKAGAALSVVTLISRLTGLFREQVKAALLGTSFLSDAFTVAFIIPNFLRRLFAEGSISVAFIPTFKRYLVEGNRRKTREFLCATLTMLSFLVTLTVALGMLASPLIVGLFGSDYDETLVLTQIMFPFLALVSIAALFQGILNAVEIFVPSAVAPIVWNVVVIAASYGLGSIAGNPARAMAWGVVIGGLIQAAMQLPWVLKTGWRFFFTGLRKAFSNSGTRQVLKLISPTIVGMAAYQLNDLVSTALASGAGEGVASSLQYSLRLQELFLGIFAVTLSTITLPRLSEMAARKLWPGFNAQLRDSIELMILVCVPVTAFSLLAGKDIIIFLYKTSAFTDESVSLTLEAFRYHIAGMLFIALNRVIAPAFYSRGDTKSPTYAGIASFALNIALCAALSGPMRGGGIALALSVASAFNTFLLLAAVKRSEVPGCVEAIAPSLSYAGRLICYSAAALVPAAFVREVLAIGFAGHGRLLSAGVPLVGAGLTFAVSGLALLCFFGDRHYSALVGRFWRRRG
jgi:putative peptidoglycan lipid II flippase